jgi:chorismate dehydratase
MSFRVAIVSYHNTLPLIEAILLKDKLKLVKLIKASPAECVDLYKSGQVDIALVPVAALLEINDAKIVTDKCIGCIGSVYSVGIFSNSRLEECQNLMLDVHSKSSNLLAQIVINHMGLSDQIEANGKVHHPVEKIEENTAYVMIGDNVFDQEDRFNYKYDLGELWERYTGLPFTFAVWIGRDTIDKSLVSYFESLFEDFKIQVNQDKMLTKCLNLSSYLQDYISYDLSLEKQLALELFLTQGRKLENIKNDLILS